MNSRRAEAAGPAPRAATAVAEHAAADRLRITAMAVSDSLARLPVATVPQRDRDSPLSRTFAPPALAHPGAFSRIPDASTHQPDQGSPHGAAWTADRMARHPARAEAPIGRRTGRGRSCRSPAPRRVRSVTMARARHGHPQPDRRPRRGYPPMMRVLTSSVTCALEDERNALARMLSAVPPYEPVRFEGFVSQDRCSRDACLASVDACDVHVLPGLRYGEPLPGSSIASAEEESTVATRQGGSACVHQEH
ncbi:MAG TPA: hypothetical protein DHU96_14250 [Actinobacteria bacterium]|nr:hypothetical protein [Actinomycetota bacterium]